jgi:pimeloyl-ACP methyl ester carboxylesterase
VPDARVQAAVDHWAPRFVQAGVDYSDFLVTTAAIETWEEWLDGWCATAEKHMALAEEAEAGGHRRTAGEAYGRAAVCFHFARFVWVVDLDRSRAAGERAVAALARANELLDTGMERVEAALDGGRIVANVRRPEGADRPPLVVLIPGLDSTKEEFFRFENVFLERGMATASLDGPGQGEGGYELPIRHDYEVAVGTLLDVLDGRSDLDLDRVGAVGVSLGGYYAPRAGAFEPRLRAVAGLSGPYNFGEIWDGLPDLTRETFTAKSFSSDAEEGRAKASKLDLSGVAERIDKPFFAITGKLDRLIPWEQTERAAREAPGGRFLLHEDGNHGCANVPYKTRPVVADWMRDQLV